VRERFAIIVALPPAGHGLSVFCAGISGVYLPEPHRHPLATTPRLGVLRTLAPGGAAAWRALEQRLEQRRAARAGVGQAPQDGDGKTRRGEAGRVARGSCGKPDSYLYTVSTVT
jgi:hypothetical protein